MCNLNWSGTNLLNDGTALSATTSMYICTRQVEFHIAHIDILLGLIFSTGKMTIDTVDAYRAEVLDLLQKTWHPRHRSFSAPETEIVGGRNWLHLSGLLSRLSHYATHLYVGGVRIAHE